ncbi:MAG: lipopolysaccharide heptosyltransferase II, partial [Nitrospinota bacterium]
MIIDGDSIKNILVREPNWIGDIMMSTPAIHALRESFPNSRISVLIKKGLAPLLEGNGDIDEIISFSPEGLSPLSRISFYRDLKERDFDLALLFTNSFESALAAWLAGAKIRLGYRKDMRNLLLTHPVPLPKRESPRMHQSKFYTDLVAEAGPGQPADRLFFHVPEEAAIEAEKIWQENGLTGSSFVVGFGVGAAFGNAKRWPLERYSELANRIVRELEGKVIIFGGSGDRGDAENILSGCPAGVISLAGGVSLKTLGALLKRCDLYVTNDSGPMHIAAAVGTPIVAIFGSTDPSESAPLSDLYTIVRKEADCSPCWKRECPT